MKITGKLLVLALSCSAPVFHASAAVQAISDGYVSSSTVIKGAGSSDSALTFFALRGFRPVKAAGQVSDVSGAVLTDSNATWAENAYNGVNGPHFVEFESGAIADIVATSASGKSLTLAGPVEGDVAVLDHYRIRPHATLASVFGPNNEAGLQPGPNPSTADNILLQVAATQQTLTFFFSNVGGGFSGWYSSTFQPAGNTVIVPEQGIILRRRATADLAFSWPGQARGGPSIVPISTGFNLVGTMKTAAVTSLSQLGLFTGDPSTGFAGASNPTSGDNLLIVNPNGSTSTYFYSTVPGFTGWYSSTFVAAGSVTIPAGSAFFVQRKSPRTPFDWTIPAE